MKGKRHANGNQGGPVLPETQREAGQGECSADLPNLDGPSLEDRQTADALEREIRPPQTARQAIALNVPVPGLITEPNVRLALELAKGDLFVAATILEVNTWQLDRLIRCSPALQVFAAAIERVKQDPEYDKMSAEQFVTELHRLTTQFALDGLMVIHDLATGPASSAADRQVKLEAAMALRNSSPLGRAGGALEALLSELNADYQKHAPRIKEIRTTTLVLEALRQNEPSPAIVEALPLPEHR